jgi:hypothetical protein
VNEVGVNEDEIKSRAQKHAHQQRGAPFSMVEPRT